MGGAAVSGGIAWLCARCGRDHRGLGVTSVQGVTCDCRNAPDPDPLPRSRRERRIGQSSRATGPNWRARPGVS